LPLVDLLKLSAAEAELLTGKSKPEEAAELLLQEYPLSLIAVTCGNKGPLSVHKKLKRMPKPYRQRPWIPQVPEMHSGRPF
jgi:sugar/nucleoside kinase (ribokinase family)